MPQYPQESQSLRHDLIFFQYIREDYHWWLKYGITQSLLWILPSVNGRTPLALLLEGGVQIRSGLPTSVGQVCLKDVLFD